MFRTRDQAECIDGGPAASVAALSHDLVLGEAEVRLNWQDRLAAGLQRFERKCLHDLAEGVGSLGWYRGLGTMLGLGIAALSFWPDFSQLDAAPAVRVDAAARDEFRSQLVMPLALGGESGRRMGANPRLVQPLTAAPERLTVRMVATLAEGDGFTRMLQRAGVGAWDAARAAELVGAVLPLAEVRPGTRFEITLGQRGEAGQARPLDKLEFRARFDTALALSRTDAGLTIDRRAIPVDTTPLRIRGTVGAGLYRSARAAGAPIEAIQQYLQAVDQHLGLDNVAPGDAFDLVIAYKRSASGEAEAGKLMFAGLEQGGKPRLQLMRWGDKGELFDAANMGGTSSVMAEPSGGLLMPVAGRITSGFGMRRHPILRYARMHAGVDFGAGWGSPIFAVASGIVSYAGRHGGHGNYVRLDHGGGLGTGYGHMSRIAVSPGTQVSAGQVIGYVGSTGLSTGPHLHWEVYQGGRTVNPLAVSFASARIKAAPVDTKQFAAFKARLDQLKGIKPGAALSKLAPKTTARIALAD